MWGDQVIVDTNIHTAQGESLDYIARMIGESRAMSGEEVRDAHGVYLYAIPLGQVETDVQLRDRILLWAERLRPCAVTREEYLEHYIPEVVGRRTAERIAELERERDAAREVAKAWRVRWEMDAPASLTARQRGAPMPWEFGDIDDGTSGAAEVATAIKGPGVRMVFVDEIASAVAAGGPLPWAGVDICGYCSGRGGGLISGMRCPECGT